MKIFRNIASAWRSLKGFPIAYNIVLIAIVFAAVVAVSFVGMTFGTRHGMKRTVPDFTGLRLNDAEYYAGRRGLEIVVNDSLYVPAYPGGIVLDQLPNGGVDVKSGRKIYVTINSFHQKKVPLPYVAGRSLRQAKNMLETAGLTIRELVYVEDIATNYVLGEYYDGQEITADSKIMVEMGSGITLHVGEAGDYALTGIPQLVGRSLRDAQSRLWEAGLNVGDIVYDEGITILDRNDARVYRQSQLPGRSVQVGVRISLHLTTDAAKIAEAEAESERQAAEALEMRAQLDSIADAEAQQQRETLERQAAEQSATEDSMNDDGFFQ